MKEFAGDVMGYLKLIAVVIIGIFIFKILTGALANRWPNSVTNAVNRVVQAA
ncbi:MAG: hypothetical protein K6T83_07875 [Alicyclobacillus sp.]|nr:hypothetical protein [Alicyclobacillus sp.]